MKAFNEPMSFNNILEGLPEDKSEAIKKSILTNVFSRVAYNVIQNHHLSYLNKIQELMYIIAKQGELINEQVDLIVKLKEISPLTITVEGA